MATTLPELQNSPEPPEPNDLPSEELDQEVLLLEDRLPHWFRSRPAIMVFAVAVGIVFVFFNARRLYHSDVWGHLAYGRLIVEQKSIPDTAPLLVMAEGVPFVDTAWLSQIIGYGAWQAAGAAGISFLYGSLIALSCGLLVHRLYQRTGSVFWPLLAGGLFLLVNWQQLMIPRPQLAGLACFMILMHQLRNRQWSNTTWFVVPALFVFWANCHGSFVVGLALLGAAGAGQFVDVWRHSGRFELAVKSRNFLRPLLLLEIAAVATLVNPYGLHLYTTVLTFAENPNLNNLIEWDPLNLRMYQGMAAAAAAALLFTVYRLSPRRIRTAEILMLAGLGGLALWTSRMLIWWAPVAAYCVALHGHAAWNVSALRRRWTGFSLDESSQLDAGESAVTPRSLWSVCAIGIGFICLSLTPLFVQLKSGEPRSLEQSVSQQTPIGAVEYLNSRDNLPRGPIFNSFGQGDYLMFAGEDLKPFVASHVHLIPREVWRAHIEISRAGDDAADKLARYGVNMLVLDTTADARLLRASRRSPEWREVYSDDRSAVLLRKEPI